MAQADSIRPGAARRDVRRPDPSPLEATATGVSGDPADFSTSVAALVPLPTLRVCGELDLLTAVQMGQRLGSLIGCSTGDVVVDLADVSFVDAAGVHVLLDAQRRLLSSGRRMTITPTSTTTLRVLELAGVAPLFGATATVGDLATD